MIGRKVIRMSSPLHKLACRSLRICKLRNLHNTGGNTYPTLQVASPAFVTVSDSQFKHLEIQTNKSEPDPEPHSSKERRVLNVHSLPSLNDHFVGDRL